MLVNCHAPTLAPALGHLSRLAALLLYNSRVGAAGAAALAPPIAPLTALLQLEANELGAGGAVPLGRC